MSDQQKLVQVGDSVVAFPSDMSDEQITTAIRSFVSPSLADVKARAEALRSAPPIPPPAPISEQPPSQVAPATVEPVQVHVEPPATQSAPEPEAEEESDHSKEETEPTKYKFGNTQADIPQDSEAGEALAEARLKIDKDDLMPSTNTTDGSGLEENSHVTIRYGIDGEDTEGIRSYLEKQTPFEATLGKTTSFPPSEHSDGGAPIVVEVESPDLRRMEKEIDTHGNFIERTFPDYRPHVTLAYIKPGAAEKYVGMDTMDGKKFTINSVSISKKDGSIEEVPFKGKPKKNLKILKPSKKRLKNSGKAGVK